MISMKDYCTELFCSSTQNIPTHDKIHEEMKNSLSYPGSCDTLRVSSEENLVLPRKGWWVIVAHGKEWCAIHTKQVFKRCEETLKHRQEHWVFGQDESWSKLVSKCWVKDDNAGQAMAVTVPARKGGHFISQDARLKGGFVPKPPLFYRQKNFRLSWPNECRNIWKVLHKSTPTQNSFSVCQCDG